MRVKPGHWHTSVEAVLEGRAPVQTNARATGTRRSFASTGELESCEAGGAVLVDLVVSE